MTAITSQSKKRIKPVKKRSGKSQIPEQVPIDHLYARHPNRPVDWRWRLGHELHQRSESQSQDGDADVGRVVAYLCALHSDPERSAQAWPELAQALQIRNAKSTKESMRRVDLEAYILAGERDTALARRFGLAVDVIRAYESVLFDGRNRRHDPGAVIGSFMTASDWPVAESNWSVVTRLLGFHGSTDVLDEYRGYRQDPLPTVPPHLWKLTRQKLEHLLSRLRFRTLMLATLAPPFSRVPQHWANLPILAASRNAQLLTSAVDRAIRDNTPNVKGVCYWAESTEDRIFRPLLFGARRSAPAKIAEIIVGIHAITAELEKRGESERHTPVPESDYWTSGVLF